MNNSFYGKAYNSRRKYKTKIKGEHTPAYRTWRNMIKRCYCPKYQKDKPTYIDCSVAHDWHDFQDFAEWYENHEYSNIGYHLDKDLLLPNNKIYSPDRCCFVPVELNSLLTNHANARGRYPQGVSYDKRKSKFSCSVSLNAKGVLLGWFDCPDEAHQVYKETKERYVKNKALEWANRIEWNVFVALMNWTLDK